MSAKEKLRVMPSLNISKEEIETELVEKLERLFALNALLNMDETGNDAQVESETLEQPELDALGHDDQRAEQLQADTLGHSDQRKEQAEDMPQSVSMENAGQNHTVENGSPRGLKLAAGNADKLFAGIYFLQFLQKFLCRFRQYLIFFPDDTHVTFHWGLKRSKTQMAIS